MESKTLARATPPAPRSGLCGILRPCRQSCRPTMMGSQKLLCSEERSNAYVGPHQTPGRSRETRIGPQTEKQKLVNS